MLPIKLKQKQQMQKTRNKEQPAKKGNMNAKPNATESKNKNAKSNKSIPKPNLAKTNSKTQKTTTTLHEGIMNAKTIATESNKKSIPKPNHAKTNSKTNSKSQKTTATLHVCTMCHLNLPRSEYSKTQWKKKQKKCSICAKKRNTNNTTNTSPTSKETKAKTPVLLTERPQRSIPGFEGLLTCCTDFPQTKRGQPPNAQSAVFNPLIACCLGPLEGYSTQTQLDFAFAWWSKVLPAWPRWVETLRNAGICTQKSKLLQRAKGKPNPLIHKAKGHGTVPHFRGTDQIQALELDMMCSIEIYACVQCLYSSVALDKMQKEEQEKEEAQEK